MTIDGAAFRTLDNRSWEARQRVADMDAAGVAAQVLSPMPELLSFWFDIPAANAMCEHMNATIAGLVTEAPDRFCGLGMIPMQDPDAAIKAMADLRPKFGLRGFEIGTHIDGTLLGDARFDPVYAAAQDMGLAIFVHALHPLATKSLAPPAGRTPLVSYAGFPLDTGLAAASLLAAGVLSRFPKLKIVLGHGGGALGSIIGRLDTGWRTTGGYGGAAAETPSTQARRLFYDSNVYDPVYLHHLATRFAPGQVVLGTDYPYDIMQQDPLAYLRSADLPPDALESLMSGAALRLLA